MLLCKDILGLCTRILLKFLYFLIGIYKYLLSPLLPLSCRFVPSCSVYAKEALAQHGLRRGLWLMLRRLIRCHPWGGSGYDPVPPRVDVTLPRSRTKE